MTRRQILAGAALAPALLSQTRKRNLIFILSDDHRYDMMSCMGHPWLKTPHLDRMVRGGVMFDNAFVTTSLCSPSRACVLTGQYAHAHGVTDNITQLPKSLLTFPQVLQKHGYRTAYMGKWHMGGDTDEQQPGFDRWVSFRGQGEYWDPTINFDGDRKKVKGYMTDIITEESVKFIEQNKSRPFMMYVGHKAVHADFYPADRHKDLYKSEPVPYPETYPNTDATYQGKPKWVREQRNSWHGVDGMYNKRIQFEPFYRDYCRTLQALDDSVGTVMDALESRRLLNDTLLVYMGDNGFMLGEFGLIDKRCMYEPSIRVPLIAHCPDLFAGGKREKGMAAGIDIGPTLLEAAGAPIPGSVHGRSWLPLLTGRSAPWRTEFLYEYPWERSYPQTPTVIGLRTDQYSFMHYHGIWDVDELYDIQADPHQKNNLLAEFRTRNEGGPLFNRITDPGKKALVADFQKRIARIMSETGGRTEPSWRM
ncbi:MAG: sulfatase [Bryobacteraceae bacterium]